MRTTTRAEIATSSLKSSRQIPSSRAGGPAYSSVSEPLVSEARRYERGRLVWRVPCGDVIDRERCVTLFVEDSQVVMISPAGEAARLTTDQLVQLKTALNEAAKMAER